MIDLDIGINAKLGSSKWQAKNGEELVVTMGYENNDLAFSMDTDLLKAGSTSSDIESSCIFKCQASCKNCGLGQFLADQGVSPVKMWYGLLLLLLLLLHRLHHLLWNRCCFVRW